MGGMLSQMIMITFGHRKICNQLVTHYYHRKPFVDSASSQLITVYLHKLRSRSQRLLPSTPVQLTVFLGNPKRPSKVVDLYTLNSGWEPEYGIGRSDVYQVAVPDRTWWKMQVQVLS